MMIMIKRKYYSYLKREMGDNSFLIDANNSLSFAFKLKEILNGTTLSLSCCYKLQTLNNNGKYFLG